MNFTPVFEQPAVGGLFTNLVAENICGKNMIEKFHHIGITSILVRDDLTMKWLQDLPTQEKACVIPVFRNAANPLISKNGYTLFQLTK